MKIIAVYSIKGGVGKTATAVNLVYLASMENRPVLLVDLDPQGSASYYYRIRPSKKLKSPKLLKGKNTVDKYIKGTDFLNLDLLPSDFSYRKLDLLLNNKKRTHQILRDIFLPYKDEYEYIFLDCPPNITLLSENIFFAADMIIVPVIPTTLSILTYNKLVKFFEKKEYDFSKLVPFFSMVESKKTLHNKIVQNTNAKKNPFLTTQIPYLSDVEKMGLYREPLVHKHPNSKAATAFRTLWEEIKNKK